MSESSSPEPSLADEAELRMVDALLSSMSPRADDDRDMRVRRVMDAIETSPSVSGKQRPWRFWRSLVAAAACLMVLGALSWLQFSRPSHASDVLREVAAASLEPVDRVYSLRRVVSTPGEAGERAGRLYLRGCDGFVVVCDEVVLGRNADQFWFVPKDGPVVIAEDFEWLVGTSEREKREIELLNVLAVDSRSLPLVPLSSSVEMMRHEYEVTLEEVTRDSRRLDLLVGELNNPSLDLPDTIRLWADGDSRIVERAELEWRRPHEQSPANMVILELLAAEDVGAEWYEHEAHHASGRPVNHVLPGS